MAKHANLSSQDRDMLAGWAVSASHCWLVMSAAAVLAAMAHVFDLI